jgi:glycosyltransferase involved in cell wall biosynthesis
MSTSKAKVKICFVTTVPYQIHMFLETHILALLPYAEILIVTNGHDRDICGLPPTLTDRVKVCNVGFRRQIRPIHDLSALLQLVNVLRHERPDIVLSMSPKAGLLCALAGWALRLPIRGHWFTGQVWANRQGLMRGLLKWLDTLISKLSTNLLADSASQREFLIDQQVAHGSKIEVLGSGSTCGVNTDRFQPNPSLRTTVRRLYDIPDDAVLALFLGRITAEKGVLEIAQALLMLSEVHVTIYAMFVGPDEGNVAEAIRLSAKDSFERIVMTGYSNSPESFMAAADFLVLPSYREGFPLTIIEAAGCGIPTIGSRIYGITDAILDGETGLLVEPRNARQLADAMQVLSINRDFRVNLGRAARARALVHYQTAHLNAALISYFDRLLRGIGRTGLLTDSTTFQNCVVIREAVTKL